MKTILCPVDFTATSDKVARYAAQLAAKVHAKVVLVPAYSQARKGLKVKVKESTFQYDMSDRLGELHDLIAASYHIPCKVEEESISGNIYKKLSQLADHYDILITGMKATQDNPVNSLEMDLLKLIHETLAPIYFVPENYEYQSIARITYAFDPKQEPNPPLLTLYWLADWFDANVKFVSVLPTNISLRERNRLTTAQNFVEHEWSSSRKLSFEAIVQDDIPSSLENHIWSGEKNDLLVLSVNHARIPERIWHKSVVKRLLKNALSPYLIIHR